MKRIYIYAYTEKNFGDDLFVRTLCERYPDHHFYIECRESVDSAFQPIRNLTVLNRSTEKGKWIQRIRKWSKKFGVHVNFSYDAQVYIGGSIFIEFEYPVTYEGYFKKLYASRVQQNLPYFIIGSNFGPYRTRDFVEKHKEFFRYQVTDLCMRDRSSCELFSDLPHVRYAPDIICTYSMPAAEKKNLVLISCIYDDGREEIRRFDNEAYEKKLTELCAYYLSLGKEVCLLSMFHLQKDHVMCQRIKEHFSKGVSVAEYNGNIDEVLHLFSSAEYVISSRFHGVILGWLAKVPVFPVYYSDKTLNVIHDYGFQGTYCSVNDLTNLSCEEIDRNRKMQYVFDIDPLTREAQRQFSRLDEFMQEKSL